MLRFTDLSYTPDTFYLTDVSWKTNMKEHPYLCVSFVSVMPVSSTDQPRIMPGGFERAGSRRISCKPGGSPDAGAPRAAGLQDHYDHANGGTYQGNHTSNLGADRFFQLEAVRSPCHHQTCKMQGKSAYERDQLFRDASQMPDRGLDLPGGVTVGRRTETRSRRFIYIH